MSEGLAKRVAGTLVLGVIGLIVLPLLIDFTDPNKVDRTTKIPPAPSIEVVSLERAKRPETVTPKEAWIAGFNVHKSSPAATNDGDDFGLTDKGLPQSWSVQVGSFTEEPKAKKLLKKLADKGYKAFIERALIAGENHYRVVVGPKIDWRRAKADSQTIDRVFKTKSIILRYES